MEQPQQIPADLEVNLTLPAGACMRLLDILDETPLPRKLTNPLYLTISKQVQEAAASSSEEPE